jgi:hypothetical protein
MFTTLSELLDYFLTFQSLSTHILQRHLQLGCVLLVQDSYPLPLSLRAGLSADRIQVEVRFSAPVQTGPGAHPASCTMDTGSFSGIKRPGRGANHPTPISAKANERVTLYLYSPLGLKSLYRDPFTFLPFSIHFQSHATV